MIPPLVRLLLAFQALVALPQAPGSFAPTGNLSTPRHFHTATLLPTGKVLVAGGSSGCATPAGAELYDPATRTFTAAGAMATARYFHTATLLPNGKVLIAGGATIGQGCSASELSSAELYDPLSGSFRAVREMNAARFRHTATLLDDGRVLIAGGYARGVPLRSAELFDPVTERFAFTGDLTEPAAETATLLSNGNVLITRSFEFGFRNKAELYDPARGTFARAADLAGPYQGSGPAATLLTNGKVLIAGGSLGDLGGSRKAQLYDPVSGSFSQTAEMITDMDTLLAAVLLPDGQVLIAGRSSYGIFGGAAELYDPVAGTFGEAIHSQSAEGHTATLLPDGTVLVSGGWVCCGYTIATAEIYTPAVLTPSPVLFSLAGSAEAAILHADTHQVVSATNPVSAREVVEIYLTGLVDASVIPPRVAIGGRSAEVLWFGNAPGFSNLNQINVRVPTGIVPGPTVPVRLQYMGRPSNEVTLAVQ